MSPTTSARALAAVASGYTLSWVSPPSNLHYLHWFAFIPLLWALDPKDRKLNFRLGYLSGFTAVFFLFFWLARTIDIFSNIPLWLSSLVVVLFALVWGLPYGVLATFIGPIRLHFPRAWILLFPSCWVGIELLWPSLFPYYQGVGQYRTPYIWQLASVFGAYGLTWLILAVNCAFVALLQEPRRPAIPLAVGALWFINLGFGWWRFNAVEAELSAAPVARVSILQQGITMVERLEDLRRDHGKTAFNSWVKLTEQLKGQELDLVVWPEGAVPFNPHQGKAAEVMGKIATAGNFNFLVGGGTSEPSPDEPKRRLHWNSTYLFDRSGKVSGRYDKMVPLPFGEYLPWPLGFLRNYIEGPGNFRAGNTPYVFQTDRFSFTVPICYEAILEDQMRRLSDGDVFVNITNDGWFGDTDAPHQHAMLSAAYAVELGRPMLRIGYTGISMVVEPHGVIREETQPYTDVAKVVELRVATYNTPYRTWGRAFPWVCALISLAAVFRSRRALAANPAPPVTDPPAPT